MRCKLKNKLSQNINKKHLQFHFKKRYILLFSNNGIYLNLFSLTFTYLPFSTTDEYTLACKINSNHLSTFLVSFSFLPSFDKVDQLTVCYWYLCKLVSCDQSEWEWNKNCFSLLTTQKCLWCCNMEREWERGSGREREAVSRIAPSIGNLSDSYHNCYQNFKNFSYF